MTSRVPGEDEAAWLSQVSAQIGRPAVDVGRVVVRCHLGLPVVLWMPPRLPDGTPFPTRHWLTCPLLHRRVASLEATGWIQRFEARRATDAAFERALRASHERERAARAEDLRRLGEKVGGPPSEPLRRGGVGGAREGVKCLHAHLAGYLAGDRDNPVGEAVHAALGEPRCERPCVVPGPSGGSWRRNPAWRPSAEGFIPGP